MGVATGCGCKEVYRFLHTTYIPTPLVSVLFYSSIPTFVHLKKCFSFFIYINPLHFLARSAVCPQMSCTSCLSNNNIQMPDQVSVPCTTPYFHKDTLTPPSRSRSLPLTLEGGGPSTYAARDASLYNARPLL